jgi:hypothetical protein
MSGNSLRLAAITVFLTMSAGTAAQPLDLPAPPPPGVILLRNGQVIEGRVEPAGDHYQVFLRDGELRLKAADVEFVCHDLEEGYQRKRATVQPGNVQEHLQLAQWCQRYGLLGCAANEISAAMDIDPAHPMIAVLQRRLKTAMEKPEDSPRRAEQRSKVPSPEELDKMVRGMPPGTVESFAQVIQPILMNHCMTGGCHGQQSENHLQLLRAPLGHPASRRVTQRNLCAVLQWIDRDDPAKSRLLTACTGPHGPSKVPVFTDRQVVQYRRIMEWVYQVAQQPAPDGAPDLFAEAQNPGVGDGSEDTTQPRVLPPKTPHARPMPRPDRKVHSEGVVPATDDASTVEEPARKSQTGRPLRPGPPSAKPAGKPGQRPTGQGDPPGDPFDPQPFNNQSAPTTVPPSTALPTPAAKALRGKTE